VQKGYRITRHAGHTADSATATLLCTSPDEMSAWRYFQACAGHVSGAVEIRRQHSCVPIRAGKTVIVTCLPRLEPRSFPALFALHRCNDLQSSAARPDFIGWNLSTFGEIIGGSEPELSETQPGLTETNPQSSA